MIMTRFTIELKDLDDCDRATLQGMVATALATDENVTRALLFRGVSVYEVRDDEPLTLAEGTGGVLTVRPGFPATVEYGPRP
jgi:hypothetical protein